MRKFYGTAYTDVGTVKTVNQDSLMIRISAAGMHETAFAVVCDGMGGLQQGELASATVVRACEKWYAENLPLLLEQQYTENDLCHILKDEWNRVVLECNSKIRNYGQKHGVNLGTTLTAMLMLDAQYYILHVGDGRVYEFANEGTKVLTRDQTYVAREVELGHMTPQQAANDNRRSVLLQCIGVNEVLQPDFIYGKLPSKSAYLICTDGFWHEPPVKVLHRTCYEDMQMLEWKEAERDINSDSMQEVLAGLASRSKQRGERDNLSAILIQVR